MVKVALPPGCYGLSMQDGTRYDASRDGRVEVRDEHAAAIRRGWYGSAGVMVATEPMQLGTKKHRTCTACQPSRRWNVWTISCPRCGTPTEEK